MAAETHDVGTARAVWREFVNQLVDQPDPVSAPFVLAQICLLTSPIVSTPIDRDIAGLPPGRPDLQARYTAGRALLAHADLRDDSVGNVWALLGELQAYGTYKRIDTGNQSLEEARAGVRRAVEAGAALGPEFESWALMADATLLRNAHRYEESLAVALQALALLRTAPIVNADAPSHELAAATSAATWLPLAAQMSAVLEFRAHNRIAAAARMLRRYEKTAAHLDDALVVTERISDLPMLRCQAYGERSLLARTLGDFTTALSLQAKQREFADNAEDRRVYLRYLTSAAASAVALDDWDRATQLRRERIAGRFKLLAMPVNENDPAAVLGALPGLIDAARQADATAIGNDAYELARYLLESGRAQFDPAARAKAAAWLDVADAAWADIGVNGDVAVKFRRIELEALNGSRDPHSIGRDLLECSDSFLRVAGRRRTAVKAAQYGDPTDVVVLDRLRVLRDDAPTVDAAHLDLGIARWHLRHGDAARAAGDVATARRAWSEATVRAADSANGLTLTEPGRSTVPLDAAAVVEAHQIHGYALRNLRRLNDGSCSADDELNARMACLPGIARRFTACGSPGQRAVLDRLYRRWLTETLELAVELQNAAAVDATTEVIRRDLVGTVLYAMASDDGMPLEIARLAEQLIAAIGAKVADIDSPTETSTDDEPSTGQRGGDSADMDAQTRGSNLADQLSGTLDVVGQVLGPIARTLFDPGTVSRYTVRAAAEALYSDGPGAVLSLVLLKDNDNCQVLRHLALRPSTGEPLQLYLDIVPAPAWLPELSPDPNPDEFFGRVAFLTDVLLPAPLIEALSSASEDLPLPLAVVPTGLLAVPFTALRVAGGLVLDRAIVAVAQSLQTLENLAAARRDASGGVEVGVYDTQRLRHTETEWQALVRHHPAVRAAQTLGDIDHLLADPTVGRSAGLLALAVHGMRGSDGWTQAKKLPSGERLTTGHVLRWYIPALVVGASCNTDIRADSGGELGGFPLAFQIRGAVNIVGALHYIDDAATGEIMAGFYQATSVGIHTSAALRAAQRQWISVDRRDRLSQYHLWAYLLTYGVPV
ncbi:CHAT domain-containing protein [Catellatospora chokoriensis]|uniref:CHAT domain-containing protein n=1 Tax=Catellatospora chokoriensis TaxID=310353 RepID=A0A8J3JSU6_9ACTN|nr:CHAT domain-containing protein [Catellatospora chokoriensis]GIF90441.1 hypothetical protein Cch02nite_38850 [Catellatospora chokoriensis]